MGFKSLFPFFNRDEVTPSEPDNNPDVESRIGRTLSRLQGFANILGVFKFLRADYNGRLHISQAATDFENTRSALIPTINGSVTIAPANPDRQTLMLSNEGTHSASLTLIKDGLNLFSFGILPGDVIEMIGYPHQVDVTSTFAGDNIRVLEI